jgi:hypothetical protein
MEGHVYGQGEDAADFEMRTPDSVNTHDVEKYVVEDADDTTTQSQ